MLKYYKCLCEHCDCACECEYCLQIMNPILDVINHVRFFDDSFLNAIGNAIENFECEYYEKKM